MIELLADNSKIFPKIKDYNKNKLQVWVTMMMATVFT